MAYLFVFLILLFADQITKAAAFAVYGSNGPLIYWIPNFLGLRNAVFCVRRSC